MIFTKTIIEAVKYWINGNFISHNKQTLTDSQKAQARENIDVIAATADDALAEMIADGTVKPVMANSNTMYVDGKKAIYTY